MLAGGLAVFAVAVLTILLLTFARGGKESPAQNTVQNAPANKEQVLDAVYLSLFSFGLDKNSIKEKSEVDTDNDSEIKMKIDSFHIEPSELKERMASKLAEIGLSVDRDEGIKASNEKVRLSVEFIQPVVLEKKANEIAFVIDDCGYSVPLIQKLSSLPYPLTFAVIPYTPEVTETAKIIRENKKTLFLHQPMQPISYPKNDPGKGAVLLNMPESLIASVLQKNVENLGGIDGFNNHMGSAVTRSRDKMQQVFKSMRKYTDTFVDSYTANDSVAFDECKAAGYKCGLNRKFIDNESDYSYIRSKIIEGTQIARDEGSVIMIGHLREGTVDALEKILPELKQAGYNLVSIPELVQQ